MKSVLGHAALLLVALVAAFLVWTAREIPESERTQVEIWDRDPAELTSLTFRAPDHTLVIERRGERGKQYLWASETVYPPQPPRLDSTAPAPPAQPAQTEQYPLSEQGSSLVERLARLRAERDLGKPERADLEAFGLIGARDSITLAFRGDEPRVLVVGGAVVGGGHQYVFDRSAGRVYVLAADLLQPLEFAGSLRLSRIVDFSMDDVRGVVLRAGGEERVMRRQPSAEMGTATWSDPATGRVDQTFSNFMEQLSRLFPTRYRPELSADSLQPLVRAAFLGAKGDTLGTLELFRTPGTAMATYFLRTPSTIVPAEAYTQVAERVEQDLRTVFGATGR